MTPQKPIGDLREELELTTTVRNACVGISAGTIFAWLFGAWLAIGIAALFLGWAAARMVDRKRTELYRREYEEKIGI